MDETASTRRDWRIWFGVASTLFWLWLGILYIAIVVGWANFIVQPVDALGGFLEGAFAPLAFLWLVIGFFLQQRELRNNNLAIHAQYGEMRRAAEIAERQADALADNALHQRQETFLLVADRVHHQLATVVGLLWMSSRGPGNPDAVSEEMVNDLWSQVGAGDPDAFARQFMGLYFRLRHTPGAVHDLFFGTEVRARHSETIRSTFERLLESAGRCDPDGIITDALLGSGHGMLYRIIQDEQSE